MVRPLSPSLDADAFDHAIMKRALDLARQAADLGEVPVGSVIVRDSKILSQAYNLRETLHDPTAHAERMAITLAGRARDPGDWKVARFTSRSSLAPCARARLCKVELLASFMALQIEGRGLCQPLPLVSDSRLNHRALITAGVMEKECGEILSLFFQDRRVSSKLNRVDPGDPEGAP